jgi:hypothetical protein
MSGNRTKEKHDRYRTMHGTNEADVIVTPMKRAVRLLVVSPKGASEAHMAGEELDKLIRRLTTYRDRLAK